MLTYNLCNYTRGETSHERGRKEAAKEIGKDKKNRDQNGKRGFT